MIGHKFSGKIDFAGFITCIDINSEKLINQNHNHCIDLNSTFINFNIENRFLEGQFATFYFEIYILCMYFVQLEKSTCLILILIDQWSPLNPEGKRLYDRDFLLSIQYSSESTQKPAGLPDLPDIILDKVGYFSVFKFCVCVCFGAFQKKGVGGLG